jgi:hypothetical protein
VSYRSVTLSELNIGRRVALSELKVLRAEPEFDLKQKTTLIELMRLSWLEGLARYVLMSLLNSQHNLPDVL